MNSFGKFLKHYKKKTSNTHIALLKYRNASLKFGAIQTERIEKRKKIRSAIETSGLTLPLFFETRCRFIKSSDPIYFYEYDNVEFVVKDTHSAFQNIKNNNDEEEDEDASDTTNNSEFSTTNSIHNDPNYDPIHQVRNNEGDIHEYLTTKALEENFENILMSYYFDGKYLILEKATDFKGNIRNHVNTLFYIISFLLRHNIRHGDFLIKEFPNNNLFLIDSLQEPVVGDFGASENYKNSYERLQDVSNFATLLNKNSAIRMNQIREKYNLQNIVILSATQSKLKQKLRSLQNNDPMCSETKTKLQEIDLLIQHLTDTSSLSKEEYDQAEIIVTNVMTHFFNPEKWD
jgi:hypothetical protein